MRSIAELPRTGTRRYVRALATSQGNHFTGIRASTDGHEQLDLQAEHDQVSDGWGKLADDDLLIALEQDDIRDVKNYIRVSINHRAESYRFEALEDDRRLAAQGNLTEAHDANLAGSRTCDEALRQKPACKHGRAA